MPHSRPISQVPSSDSSEHSPAASSGSSLSTFSLIPAIHLPKNLSNMTSASTTMNPFQIIISYLSTLITVVFAPFLTIFYEILQYIIVWIFKPTPPPENLEDDLLKNPYGRIAVVGAGLTGISSAAHCIAHNFEVVIFDKNSSIGGIWSNVNKTSGLQINSFLYRFHPAIIWKGAFPKRDEILSEIRRIWKEYRLESRTRLNTEVKKIRRTRNTSDQDKDDYDPEKYGHSRWIVNDGDDGIFDAIIVTIGTCGEQVQIDFEGREVFEREDGKHGKVHKIVHSSQLDSLLKTEGSEENENSDSISDKKFVIIGSGASGVEACEWALSPPVTGSKAGDGGSEGSGASANHATIIARDDKWIIPRNVVWDTMLAMQPFGREMWLSFIPEWFIKTFFYRDLADAVAPVGKGIFQGTPIVNSTFLPQIRAGRASYIRGDTLRFTERGVLINKREKDAKPGDDGIEEELEADVVVMATGFKKPGLDFLPEDLFPAAYERPNLYLQTFCTEDWSVLLTNSSYVNAIGTVGHFHIGIYTRILLTLLRDRDARPLPKDMKLWVDLLRFVKRGASGGALSFFTYMELMIWLMMFLFFRPDRLRWAFFILQGWGVTWKEGEKKKETSRKMDSRIERGSKGGDRKEVNGKKVGNGKNK